MIIDEGRTEIVVSTRLSGRQIANKMVVSDATAVPMRMLNRTPRILCSAFSKGFVPLQLDAVCFGRTGNSSSSTFNMEQEDPWSK